MKKINSFDIDTSNLVATASIRQYTINGEKDAEFILQVFNSDQEFYDFKTKTYSATFTSTSSLSVKMKSSSFNGSINFPIRSGDTYTILLLTPPDKDTELTFGQGKYSYSTTITKVADTVLTFTPITTSTSSYEAMPTSVTSTISPISTTIVTKALNWNLFNKENDSNGFGLRLIRQPINTDWYFQTTEVISSNPAGDAVSNNTVVVADLTDIATGMELTYHKGTTAPSATTTITAINIATKTITFSTSTAFEDGETMTLRAKGSSVIQKAIGANIDFSTWNSNVKSAISAELTQTVRTDASGTTVTLSDTYGISGGGFVTVSGANIVNTSENKVQTVTADVGGGGGDGLVVMQVAQTAAQGTKLYFTGSTKKVIIVNNIVIKKNPSSNKTIYLNLDNFITPGVSGS